MSWYWWVLLTYIETVWFCRYLNYHAYIRGLDEQISPKIWFIPFLNLLGICIELYVLITSENFKNWWPMRKFLGKDWGKIKERYRLDHLEDNGEN